MSKLGYFLGGAVTGILGLVGAALLHDAYEKSTATGTSEGITEDASAFSETAESAESAETTAETASA